ncbi:MAG: hypothetical protein J7513_00565 [Solirubrobacteraceae bacterium]|nr:hypothetical protein [Solirubrobacteraceae bacterium]
MTNEDLRREYRGPAVDIDAVPAVEIADIERSVDAARKKADHLVQTRKFLPVRPRRTLASS